MGGRKRMRLLNAPLRARARSCAPSRRPASPAWARAPAPEGKSGARQRGGGGEKALAACAAFRAEGGARLDVQALLQQLARAVAHAGVAVAQAVQLAGGNAKNGVRHGEREGRQEREAAAARRRAPRAARLERRRVALRERAGPAGARRRGRAAGRAGCAHQRGEQARRVGLEALRRPLHRRAQQQQRALRHLARVGASAARAGEPAGPAGRLLRRAAAPPPRLPVGVAQQRLGQVTRLRRLVAAGLGLLRKRLRHFERPGRERTRRRTAHARDARPPSRAPAAPRHAAPGAHLPRLERVQPGLAVARLAEQAQRAVHPRRGAHSRTRAAPAHTAAHAARLARVEEDGGSVLR